MGRKASRGKGNVGMKREGLRRGGKRREEGKGISHI